MLERKYRAVVVDLDGTILNDRGKIDEKLAERIRWLHEEGLLMFSVATGRVYSGAIPFVRQLNIRLPIILSNGALLVSPEGQTLFCKKVPKSVALEIGKVVKELDSGNLYINVFWGDTIFTERISSVIRKYIDFVDIDIRIVRDVIAYMECRDDDPLKILVIGDDSEAIKIAYPELDKRVGRYVEMFRSYSNYLEIVNKGIDKGLGLRKFSEFAGIPLEEIVAVGDSENDKPMFKVAGLSVAVGNAMPEVKDTADVIIDKEDGEAIWKLIDMLLGDS
ncbi:MAG: HAD family hydrolase [Synergistetes bacterium]|nr:HAD family hydrolase [Synergistota bacterium]